MNLKPFILYVLLGLVSSIQAQESVDAMYVRVPEKFEFLKEPNQYQLNALTAFLLEKYGFKALFQEDLPEGLEACDVLYANVHNKSGMFSSRLFLTLEDCQNEVVFTSPVGKSREKDFKKGYHEALREAFVSLDKVEHKKLMAVVEDEQVVSGNPSIEEGSGTPLTAAETSQYKNGGVLYRLSSTDSGFELTSDGKDPIRLVTSSKGEHYIYSSGKVQGTAFFDEQENIIVEYLNDQGQLVNLIFQKTY